MAARSSIEDSGACHHVPCEEPGGHQEEALERTLAVGAFQFAGGPDVGHNLAAVERGARAAAAAGVRLLLTQECALCGYPPVERPCVASIDADAQGEAADRLADLAREHGMFIAVGLVTLDETGARNSLCLLPPDGRPRQVYHKRALWGWDVDNYRPGDAGGICNVDGIRVGLRLCYEVRFPEYFRELFRERADLALVALCNVGSSVRRDVYRSHLVSRASENAMYVLSANSTSRAQLAPTCLIDPDGELVAECDTGQEGLLTGTIHVAEPGFSRKGRIVLSRALNGMDGV